MSENLLQVKNLKKDFLSGGGLFSGPKRCVHAVDSVSFQLKKGDILGIVGESGCGKSTLGRTILRLIEPTEGEVIFDGIKLGDLSREEMRQMRKQMQIVFQDPGASLNPRADIKSLIGESLDIFCNLSVEEKQNRVYDLMDLVGINRGYANRYPHEFSGGQRQRIGIARALAINPKLIICDEPVSALDVSVRAQILNLIAELKEKLQLTYIFISHDLSVVNHICNKVAVMYLGRIIESADTEELYKNPAHPYSQALFAAIPIPEVKKTRDRVIIQGDVPNPANPPSGCHFRTRCPHAMNICETKIPPLVEVSKEHFVMCHLTTPCHR